MPEHFLALVKQKANLTSNNDAERTAKAVIDSLDVTIDTRLMKQILPALPSYLQISHKHFFAQQKRDAKQFNQEIFFERLKLSLGLTDKTEAIARFSAVINTLAIIQPQNQVQLAKYLPSDLINYVTE